MKDKTKKHILPQMFDVRPVNKAGELDLEKIEKLEKIVKLETKRYFPTANKKIGDIFHDIRYPDYSTAEENRFQKHIKKEKEKKASLAQVPIISFNEEHVPKINFKTDDKPELPSVSPNFYPEENLYQGESDYFKKFQPAAKSQKKRKEKKRKYEASRDLLMWEKPLSPRVNARKYLWTFAGASLGIFLIVFGVNFTLKSLKIKNIALDSGQEAYASLLEAKDNITSQNFNGASVKFNEAYDQFSEISKDFDDLGQVAIEASKFLPFTSKLSSGAHLAAAGKDISQIGIDLTATLQGLNSLKNPVDDNNTNSDTPSLLTIFQGTDKNLREVSGLMGDLDDNLKGINPDDIPAPQKEKFSQLETKLPAIRGFVDAFLANDQIFTDVLGGNGPRKYLVLFQNNQEMRATGGFIGSYALVDIADGKIRNMLIDGIFNPDGQLQEKVVPPIPIQKISAAWSLHDSNWFPDFPTSAEKASWFYEKTGGPTVDGVITMTPTVMQKLLEITGPIDMPDYGITVDKDNFTEKVEQEVEVNYDKAQNQPKKILADLAPKLLDRIFAMKDMSDITKVLNVLVENLNQKQILIYSKNYDIEKAVSAMGWSGEILNTPKDYLSIINTNINGYKTDGVTDESIDHEASIQPDGSIIDTLTVTRHNNGGNTPYDFWNKVNSDYMRVYVPKGAKLLTVSGQTREFDTPPLDYNSLGFRRDPQVQTEEDATTVDDASGTRIYDDGEKTVFANWVYVSPQETNVIKYTYLLPFRISPDSYQKTIDTYSLLAQKQSGSLGSKFSSTVAYPDAYKIIWKYPDDGLAENNNLPDINSQIRIETDLITDKFIGVAFSK